MKIFVLYQILRKSYFNGISKSRLLYKIFVVWLDPVKQVRATTNRTIHLYNIKSGLRLGRGGVHGGVGRRGLACDASSDGSRLSRDL